MQPIEVVLVLSDKSGLFEEIVNVVHSRLFDEFVDISIELLLRFTAGVIGKAIGQCED